MRVEQGDRVRFLNDVGEGIVARVEGNLVFVEDEDGFELPVPVFEVVVVEKQSDSLKSSDDLQYSETTSLGENEKLTDSKSEYEELEIEGRDDFNPKIYIAFIRMEPSKDELEHFFVNDSNYFCNYLIGELKEDGSMKALNQGVIEPNTKLSLGLIKVQDLDVNWEAQLILFKKHKSYPALSPVSTTIKFKANKFFKENKFVANDFFYQPALLVQLVKEDLKKKIDSLTNDQIKAIIKEKEQDSVKQSIPPKKKTSNELLEIDLHIHELIDSTEGLSSGDLLQIQMKKFHETMSANISNKGVRIVFIHGVGNGTLKMEIRKELERTYKGIYYQDASFREYGYGATMVIL